MRGPVGAIRSRVNENCLAKNCKKRKCTVRLRGSPTPRIIVDFDKRDSPLAPCDTRCDYLFVANGNNDQPGWVVPIELTDGKKGESKMIAQLQAGTGIAAKYIPANVKVNFKPILAGKLKPSQKFRLRKTIITFHDKRALVHRINCGALLSNALAWPPPKKKRDYRK